MDIPVWVKSFGSWWGERIWLIIILCLMLFGFAFLLIGSILPLHTGTVSILFIPNAQFSGILRAAGLAILSSGVFAATLKAFQFSGVFREELISIIYNVDHLEQRKDIEDIWKAVSKIIYQKKFPDISDAIHRTILSTYFPTNINFYYDSIKQDVKYQLVPGKEGFLDQKDFLKINVKAVDKSKFTINYAVEQFRSKTDTDDTSFALKDLTINRKNETTKYQKLATENTQSEIGLLSTKFEIELEGSETYSIIVRSAKRFSIDYDSNKEFVSSKFVAQFDLTVEHPESIEPMFFALGTAKAFSEEGSDEATLRRSYKHLIFPQQGYKLLLVRR